MEVCFFMRYPFIIVLLFACNTIFAQGEVTTENKALIRNEHTFVFLINNNGWGMGYTYGKMATIRKKNLWNVEWVKFKDPKEYKQYHPQYPEFRRFVFGKQNEFYNFRFSYGNLFTFFQKKDKGGIEVRCFYHVGIDAGIVKPIYYITQVMPTQIVEKINKNSLPDNIYGGAPFYKGFNEIKVIPGITSKFGASFEFSNRDLVINAIEGGIGIDVFPKVIEIMANEHNHFYFASIFLSYRFGRIVNPRGVSSKSNKKEVKND